jgi:hypothetical protein
VARERHEVASQSTEFGDLVAHRPCRVEHGQRAGVGGEREQDFVGWPLAGGVGACREREDARAWRQQPFQVLRVQAAVYVGPQDPSPGGAAASRLLPRQKVGMVFEASDDDLVAGFDRRRRGPRI